HCPPGRHAGAGSFVHGSDYAGEKLMRFANLGASVRVVKTLTLACVVSVLAATVAPAWADQSPNGVSRFTRLVTSQGENILRFAHPTGEYIGVDFCGYERLSSGGYMATYALKFRSAFTGERKYS